MIIHCPACRELAPAESAVVDDEKARAGIVCSACGVVAWLPVSSAASQEKRPSAGASKPPETHEQPAADPVIARALDAVPVSHESEQALVDGLRALASRWQEYEAHRALIRRASAAGALPALGVRYRSVLQERPGDDVAQRAQQEILSFAMASLHTMPRAADDDERGRMRSVAAVVSALVLLVAVGWFLVYVLRGL